MTDLYYFAVCVLIGLAAASVVLLDLVTSGVLDHGN